MLNLVVYYMHHIYTNPTLLIKRSCLETHYIFITGKMTHKLGWTGSCRFPSPSLKTVPTPLRLISVILTVFCAFKRSHFDIFSRCIIMRYNYLRAISITPARPEHLQPLDAHEHMTAHSSDSLSTVKTKSKCFWPINVIVVMNAQTQGRF